MKVVIRVDTDTPEQAKAIRSAQLVRAVAEALDEVGQRDGLITAYVYDAPSGGLVNEYGLICRSELD